MNSSISHPAFQVHNPDGASPIVLLCEHASNLIPADYDGLGLSEADSESHAAWDPGALDLSMHLSRALDAPLIAGGVSRLVYDCNRPPEAAGAMPEISEIIEVPGNHDLGASQRNDRTESVYRPFCGAVSDVLDARGPETMVVTIHSFTPVFYGKHRAVELGILHDKDTRLADAMLAQKDQLPHRLIARNDPYGPEDGVTHSLCIHALSRGLANVMIEVRNDLLLTSQDIAGMAGEILTLLKPALDKIYDEGKMP